MDFGQIFQAIGPTLISLLQNTVANFKTTAPPATPPAVVPAGTVAQPIPAIKDLQTLLNKVLGLNPPLAVDGWLGPKTEQAIEDGIVRLKSLGIG